MNSPHVVTPKDVKDQAARNLARELLLGQVMKAAMKQLRAADKPWGKLTEDQQAAAIREVKTDVSEAIEKAVDLIATDARTMFKAQVDSVTFKEGVKAVLTMANTMASHELADTAGGSVYVVIESAARYTRESSAVPQAEPVQPALA